MYLIQCCQLSDSSAAQVKKGQKKWSGQTNLHQKGEGLKKNCYPPLILSNSREVQKICYFCTHTDKNSVFLTPKFHQKVKITGRPNFFPQWSNFSSGLVKSSAKSWKQ